MDAAYERNYDLHKPGFYIARWMYPPVSWFLFVGVFPYLEPSCGYRQDTFNPRGDSVAVNDVVLCHGYSLYDSKWLFLEVRERNYVVCAVVIPLAALFHAVQPVCIGSSLHLYMHPKCWA